MKNTEMLPDEKLRIASFVFLILDMILIGTTAVVSILTTGFLWPKILQFRKEMAGSYIGPIDKLFDFGIWWFVLVLVLGLLLVWKQRWFGLKYVFWDLMVNVCVAVAVIIYMMLFFLSRISSARILPMIRFKKFSPCISDCGLENTT